MNAFRGSRPRAVVNVAVARLATTNSRGRTVVRDPRKAKEWGWFSLSRPWGCSSDETMESFKKRGTGIICADRDEAKRAGSLGTLRNYGNSRANTMAVWAT